MKKISAEPVPDFYRMPFLPSHCLNNKVESNNEVFLKDSSKTETYPIHETVQSSSLFPRPYVVNLFEDKRRQLLLALHLKAQQEQDLHFNHSDRLPSTYYFGPAQVSLFGQNNMLGSKSQQFYHF